MLPGCILELLIDFRYLSKNRICCKTSTSIMPGTCVVSLYYDMHKSQRCFEVFIKAGTSRLGSAQKQALTAHVSGYVGDLTQQWHVRALCACRDHTRSLLSRRFSASMEEVLTSERLVFGDYLVPGADPKVYTQVTDMTRLVKVWLFCRHLTQCLLSCVSDAGVPKLAYSEDLMSQQPLHRPMPSPLLVHPSL